METARMKPSRQQAGNVVTLAASPPKAGANPRSLPAADRTRTSPTAIGNGRLPAWTDSWADEPAIHLPDMPAEVVDALPEALARARDDLAPGDPAEVLAAVTTLASRRGFPLPDDIALELDIEVMASWPRDLWRKAFRAVWEQFSYRRLPEPADFRRHIAADLEERRARLQQERATGGVPR